MTRGEILVRELLEHFRGKRFWGDENEPARYAAVVHLNYEASAISEAQALITFAVTHDRREVMAHALSLACLSVAEAKIDTGAEFAEEVRNWGDQ